MRPRIKKRCSMVGLAGVVWTISTGCGPAPALHAEQTAEPPRSSPPAATAPTTTPAIPTELTTGSLGPTEPAKPPERVTPAAPPVAIVALAEQASAELEPVLPGSLGTPEWHCVQESCVWRFPRKAAGRPPDEMPTEWVIVDGASEARVTGDFNDEQGMLAQTFLAARKLEPKIIDAAGRSPDVVQICRETKAQGPPCMLYTETMGRAVCPPKRDLRDPCLWSIYVGSNMGTHASRIATVLVDPGTLTVVGASDLSCDAMTLKGWRAKRAAEKTAKPMEECPTF